MDTHGISFVDDSADHDFALVALPCGSAWIFYKESTLCPKSLEDSWAAYRNLLASENDPGGPDGGGEASRA